VPDSASPVDERFASARHAMVETQIRARGIQSERVLEAMRNVPRHLFVPEERCDLAYEDRPVDIGEHQTASQPFMVAAMAAALDLNGSENLLEIGAGSGYAAAVLSLLVRQVYAVEKYPSLAANTRERLVRLGYHNVTIHLGDGSQGLPEFAPYDAISVAAAAPQLPEPLVEQLAEGGRMVIPVGDSENQELLLVRKHSGKIETRTVSYCRFVPLTGRYGFGG
jgi:protein-L-isoaspartate(D-aspartate) O-methyltransferase